MNEIMHIGLAVMFGIVLIGVAIQLTKQVIVEPNQCLFSDAQCVIPK